MRLSVKAAGAKVKGGYVSTIAVIKSGTFDYDPDTKRFVYGPDIETACIVNCSVHGWLSGHYFDSRREALLWHLHEAHPEENAE